MNKLIYILILIAFFSCNVTEKKSDKNLEKGNAKLLNDSAVKLAATMDSVQISNAIDILEKASTIQPDYYLALWNKMVFQNQLGKKKEAFETLQRLEKLKPENPDLKVSAGIFLELKNDSLHAREKFAIAESLYKSILDTLHNDKNQSVLMNRAINLKLLGEEKLSNEILNEIKKQQQNESLLEMIDQYINMTRKDLLTNLETRN